MKLLFTITLTLLFVFSAFGQKTAEEMQKEAKKFKNGGRYSVKYDKFDDRTLAIFQGFSMISTGEGFAEALAKSASGPMGRRSGLSTLLLGAGFTFPGNALQPDAVPQYFIYFNYSGDSWRFLKQSNLIFLLNDEERLQLGAGDADRNIKFNGVQELLAYQISKEDLQKIASARKAELKVGTLVRKLKSEHLQMFSDVARLPNP